jgi:hypothetical protein
MAKNEEGPTAVYAKKVHKGGPDEVNWAFPCKNKLKKG